MAILLAFFAAACNALATVFQRLGVEQSEHVSGTSSLLRGVIKRPVWLLGLVVMTAGFILQALALSKGTLSSVQPVMVTEIVFLAVIIGGWFHGHLGWRELGGSVGTAAGLGIFLSLSAPVGGTENPSVTDWTLLSAASAGGVVLSLISSRRGSRAWRAASFGISAAICFALTAACLKAVTNQWPGGISLVVTHLQVYGVIAAGALGLVISQHALNAGPVAASQSALLIVNPISSIAMGTWLFGDQWPRSVAHLAGAAAGLFVMFISLVVLSNSPLITSVGTGERLSHHSAASPAPLPGGRV
jgi:drug/metabolite transporter (DMT)-like permease